MANNGNIIIKKNIREMIFLVRGQRVMLDVDLAFLYGVKTKRLNEQVKRNPKRFPPEFMFQLTESEKDEVVANCDHLAKLKYTSVLPHAFTEHGAIMLASVLNSDRAIQVSIYVVKAFVSFKNSLIKYDEIKSKFDAIERKISGHDKQIRALFDAIRQLMIPPERQKRKIGFTSEG